MSDLEKDKTPEGENKEKKATEKVKDTVSDALFQELSDEDKKRMKDRYGDSKDSFVKGIRASDEYGSKVKTMTDNEVIAFAKTEGALKEYWNKQIEKTQENKPNEKKTDEKKEVPKGEPKKSEDKPAEKPAEPKKEPVKAPEKKLDDKKEEPKKTEDKPIEKPTEPKKEPDKTPEKKPDDKKEPQKVDKKDVGDKKIKRNFLKTTGDVLTYLPKQTWKGTKAIAKGVWSATKWTTHQTANLIKYPLRTTRSTVKFGRQYMDHGFSKGRREKNKGAYFDKWKWEQGKGKK